MSLSDVADLSMSLSDVAVPINGDAEHRPLVCLDETSRQTDPKDAHAFAARPGARGAV